MTKKVINIITIGETGIGANPGLLPAGMSRMNAILNSQKLSVLKKDSIVISGNGLRHEEAAKWLNLKIEKFRAECSTEGMPIEKIKETVKNFVNNYVRNAKNPLLIVDPQFVGPEAQPGTVLRLEIGMDEEINWPLTGYTTLFQA